MIIYKELATVEKDLSISARTLYSLSNSLNGHYHPVLIQKKSGGTRKLYVPDEALKNVQRAIAQKLLTLEKVSHYAKAYKPSSSILSNAKPHIGKDRILKLDILNFFDSVKYSDVKNKAFPSVRYSESIRILLSMLCYYKDVLPQGAPSSPAISNIILYDFDTAVGNYCKERRIAYTRYCDDMTFSGSLENIGELISFVEAELLKNGFVLNKKKTKCVDSSARQSVTGIVVNKKANVSDEYKRRIRGEVYYIKKFGVESHLERLGEGKSPRVYLSSLLGRINFVLSVCQNDESFKEYKKVIQDELKKY